MMAKNNKKRAAASAATCAAPRSKAAATGNPLKEKSLIVRGSELAARELVASGKPFTGAAYSRLVLQKILAERLLRLVARVGGRARGERREGAAGEAERRRAG